MRCLGLGPMVFMEGRAHAHPRGKCQGAVAEKEVGMTNVPWLHDK